MSSDERATTPTPATANRQPTISDDERSSTPTPWATPIPLDRQTNEQLMETLRLMEEEFFRESKLFGETLAAALGRPLPGGTPSSAQFSLPPSSPLPPITNEEEMLEAKRFIIRQQAQITQDLDTLERIVMRAIQKDKRP
ncbi:hypothetical protein MKEN_00915100 [Mycena kentingensis (nom. inval.)]|nr:hypothetical protein MKEN_00915100 [Mycena kentingensis (nom. inval.)]